MVLSYSAVAGGQGRPAVCRCNGQHFHRHGSYYRKVALAWVQRFICLLCRCTVSCVPDTCVPHKHHPTAVISKAIDGQMQGSSARECQNAVHPSTASRWLCEFARHVSVLATEGACRLGIPPISGFSPQEAYQHLVRAFSAGPITAFFSMLQVQLSRKLPAIGIFRVLKL